MKNLMFLILLLSLISIGCSNAYIDDIKRGAGYNYRDGHPELRMEVSEHISETNETFLRITGHVVENSLIFKKDGDSLAATMMVEIEVKNLDSNENTQLSFNDIVTRELEVKNYGEELYKFQREVTAKPGNYEVTVSVTDLATQKAIVRDAQAFLPNPVKTGLNITNISLLTKSEENDFIYSTTYDIGIDADSVRFQFQVTNNNVENPVTIESRLIKFKSDDSYASPMSFRNASPSNIIYKGIEYDDYEVIQRSRREFSQPGNVVIEYNFTDLERGNYRFEVAENLDDKEAFYKARDFGIKSPNYPAIKTPEELAKPLVYLMSEGDYEELMKIESPAALKQAIDRFWLSHIQNSVQARSVISLYYERVEEANKMFSNYKEGWKTDMGMIYILFGPPIFINKKLRQIRWSYQFNQEDPFYTYYFRNTKVKSTHYPFHNYILTRDKRYFNTEYRQRQLWLSGIILTQNY